MRLSSLALLAGLLASAGPATTAAKLFTRATSAALAPGMVSAADPRAAEAGAEMLRKGGSAVDAAFATLLALNVVEPESQGIGGGSYLVYSPRGSTPVTFDGRETAPRAATGTWFYKDGQPLDHADAVPGGKSVGVPGNLRMMGQAQQRYGKLPWAALFQPAIRLARDGFRITPRLYGSLDGSRRTGALSAEGRSLFYQADGNPKPVGTLVKNPAFAAFLEHIAARGAERAQHRRHGKPLPDQSVADDGRRYRLLQGRSARAGLRHLSRLPHLRDGPVLVGRHYGVRDAEAARAVQSYQTRPELAGRLAFDRRIDAARLRRPRAISRRSGLRVGADRRADGRGLFGEALGFDLGRPDNGQRCCRPSGRRSQDDLHGHAGSGAGAPKLCMPTPVPEHGTSHFVAVDSQGNVASETSTIEDIFGSGLMVNGYYLNNELTDFNIVPDKDGCPTANRVAGGKRPRSSMSPTIVWGPNGHVRLAVGAAGGPTIPAQVLKAIIGVIDWRLSAQQAIALPVLFAPTGDTVYVERGTYLETMIPQLQALGHEVKAIPPGFKANAIEWANGRWVGAADPRSEGTAVSQ